MLPFTDDRGSLIARESSEVRDGKLSPRKTGDLPEMSCVRVLSACAISKNVSSLTNDRRYDSKDSRDIEKGSLSDIRLRWFEDVVDVGVLCQKLFFSVGDGFSSYQPSPSKVRSLSSYWKVYTAVINHCQGGQRYEQVEWRIQLILGPLQ